MIVAVLEFYSQGEIYGKNYTDNAAVDIIENRSGFFRSNRRL